MLLILFEQVCNALVAEHKCLISVGEVEQLGNHAASKSVLSIALVPLCRIVVGADELVRWKLMMVQPMHEAAKDTGRYEACPWVR